MGKEEDTFLHNNQLILYHYIHRSIKLNNNIIALIHLVCSYDIWLIVMYHLLIPSRQRNNTTPLARHTIAQSQHTFRHKSTQHLFVFCGTMYNTQNTSFSHPEVHNEHPHMDTITF